jgi:hypothetical protein
MVTLNFIASSRTWGGRLLRLTIIAICAGGGKARRKGRAGRDALRANISSAGGENLNRPRAGMLQNETELGGCRSSPRSESIDVFAVRLIFANGELTAAVYFSFSATISESDGVNGGSCVG